MTKNALGKAYIEIHAPEIFINDCKLQNMNILESRLENGHYIFEVEILVKYKGIMDSKLEFVAKKTT